MALDESAGFGGRVYEGGGLAVGFGFDSGIELSAATRPSRRTVPDDLKALLVS